MRINKLHTTVGEAQPSPQFADQPDMDMTGLSQLSIECDIEGIDHLVEMIRVQVDVPEVATVLEQIMNLPMTLPTINNIVGLLPLNQASVDLGRHVIAQMVMAGMQQINGVPRDMLGTVTVGEAPPLVEGAPAGATVH